MRRYDRAARLLELGYVQRQPVCGVSERRWLMTYRCLSRRPYCHGDDQGVISNFRVPQFPFKAVTGVFVRIPCFLERDGMFVVWPRLTKLAHPHLHSWLHILADGLPHPLDEVTVVDRVGWGILISGPRLLDVLEFLADAI
jgi:hypothetical protein